MDHKPDPQLDYAMLYSSPVSALLHELERKTHLTMLEPEMIAGAIQGRFLSFVSKWLRPQRILEIGTYTGYSALCMAEGLGADGKLTTLERNPENESIIREYVDRSEYASKIDVIIGDAFEVVPDMPDMFDLIYLDGAKKHYCEFYDLVFDKCRVGGTIIADNVLWYGNILHGKQNTATKAIHAFNQKIAADDRVENLVLPLRDGLQLIRKL